MMIMIDRRRNRSDEVTDLRARVAELESRLQAVEDVAAEEAAMGEFLASLDDHVRAAAHLLVAAHLREALRRD